MSTPTRDDADHLAKVREVVEYHGGTWRPDNPSLAVDILVDAERDKAEKVRGKLAEALQVPLKDRRHVHPRAMADLIEFAGTILRQRDELTEFRDTVRGLLGHDYPPFTTPSEIVAELRKRLQVPEDDGVVDVDIVDETSNDYAAGHWAALNAVALLLGHSRQYAAVMTPAEIGEAIRGLRHQGDRCAACPWTGTVGCGGAEGVCEGNVVPPVGDKLDLPKVGGGA